MGTPSRGGFSGRGRGVVGPKQAFSFPFEEQFAETLNRWSIFVDVPDEDEGDGDAG